MLELILVSMSAAFLLAVAEPAMDFMEIFIGRLATNAVFSFSFSSLGAWLSGITDIRTFVLYVMAGAFLARSSLALVERAATYRPAITRPN